MHDDVENGLDPAVGRRAFDLAPGEGCGTRCPPRDQIARVGRRRGDHVAAYLPNVREAVVALLATATVGAVWKACSPDFGIPSVLARFRRVVLIAADGYAHGGKAFEEVVTVEWWTRLRIGALRYRRARSRYVRYAVRIATRHAAIYGWWASRRAAHAVHRPQSRPPPGT